MPPNIDSHFKIFEKSKKVICESDNPHSKESPDMRLESNRLKTYKNWKNNAVTPKELAKAGFYYKNVTYDVVKCAYCGVEICRWEPNDIPLEEHAKLSLDCPFVKDKIKELKTRPSLFSTIVPGRDVCSMETKKKQQSGSNFDDRLKTFGKWPKSLKQKPEELAEAGFLYSGVSDKTICFFCNGELQYWEDDDDPWEQHALCFPRCEFVKVSKGQGFVKEVLSKFGRKSASCDNATKVIYTPCVDLPSLKT